MYDHFQDMLLLKVLNCFTAVWCHHELISTSRTTSLGHLFNLIQLKGISNHKVWNGTAYETLRQGDICDRLLYCPFSIECHYIRTTTSLTCTRKLNQLDTLQWAIYYFYVIIQGFASVMCYPPLMLVCCFPWVYRNRK